MLDLNIAHQHSCIFSNDLNLTFALYAQDRDLQDSTVLEQKMNGLRMSHTRRNAAAEAAQAARIRLLTEKCATEIEELKGKQKKEYDIMVSTLPCSVSHLKILDVQQRIGST